MQREGVCIIGYGETAYTNREERSLDVYLAEAMKGALDNAGISKEEVRGMAEGSMFLQEYTPHLAERLGLELDWVQRVDCGGASGIVSIRRAADAIQAGSLDVAVCLCGGARHLHPAGPTSLWARDYVDPFGAGGPAAAIAITQRVHMAKYGTTRQQLGKIAVSQRENALLNDKAYFRTPLTMEEYLNAEMIADPLGLYDCCRRVNGAAAVIVASERRARELSANPIYLVSDAERTNFQAKEQLIDGTLSGFSAFSDELFSRISREQIDFAQLYDGFPFVVLMQLEDLGFCKKGMGGSFIDSHDLTYKGDFPVNTGGGQLSSGQPAGGGSLLFVAEAVRQLRGEAGPRQVKNAKAGLVGGLGLFSYTSPIMCAAAMILERR